MTKKKKKRKEYFKILDKIKLLEYALKEEEIKVNINSSFDEKENIERRIIDFEKHLKLLYNKLSIYEYK